jgi:hypothetical protein
MKNDSHKYVPKYGIAVYVVVEKRLYKEKFFNNPLKSVYKIFRKQTFDPCPATSGIGPSSPTKLEKNQKM